MKGQVGTRDRMLLSAVELIRERGVAGATIDAILARSDAPRGSVYYHFPGGRSQIITESIGFAGAWITNMIAGAAAAKDSHQMLHGVVESWKKTLKYSNFEAGCPMMAVAVDGIAEDPTLRAPTADVFTQWRVALTTQLIADGVDAERSRRFANMAIASIEGAVLLCRVDQSTGPLDDIEQELDALLSTVV